MYVYPDSLCISFSVLISPDAEEVPAVELKVHQRAHGPHVGVCMHPHSYMDLSPQVSTLRRVSLTPLFRRDISSDVSAPQIPFMCPKAERAQKALSYNSLCLFSSAVFRRSPSRTLFLLRTWRYVGTRHPASSRSSESSDFANLRVF